jgi:hypothetical protein
MSFACKRIANFFYKTFNYDGKWFLILHQFTPNFIIYFVDFTPNFKPSYYFSSAVIFWAEFSSFFEKIIK